MSPHLCHEGERMFLARPLLRWYLDHGIEVTDIHQVVEYQSSTCLQDFVEQVINASKALIAIILFSLKFQRS